MSAHYPNRLGRTDSDRERNVLPPIEISRDGITIGDAPNGVTLPGIWIEKYGITVEPGTAIDCSRVTVTFFVGDVVVSDDATDQVQVGPRSALRGIIREAMSEWQKAVAEK